MFGKKPICICIVNGQSMDALFVERTNKGFVITKRIDKVTFQTLKSQYHVSRVRVLLSENDTYLKLLRVPKGTALTREYVKEKAQEVIPEVVEDGCMDWKKISAGTEVFGAQVFVVKKSVLMPLLDAAEDAGILIEACEPPSLAMARLTRHVTEAFLLVYPSEKPLYVAAVSGGKVLEVASIDASTSLEQMKDAFVAYVKKLWGVTLLAIASDTPSPVFGLASKTDFDGEDMNVLTIPSDSNTKQTTIVSLPLLVGLIIVLVLALGFFSFRLLSQRNNQLQSSVTPTSLPTVAVSPTVVPIQRSQLSIEVQNGSGEAGLAGKGKKVLEDAGYTTVTTANADTYEYNGVIVRGKTTAIVEMVVSDIKSTYANATASPTFLDNASNVDAIVILGAE